MAATVVLAPHVAEEDKSGLALTDQFSDGDLHDMLNFFEKQEPCVPDSACPAASIERSSSSGSDAQRGAHSAVSSPARVQGTNATGMLINGLMGMPAAAQIHNSATAVVSLNGQLFAVPQPHQLSAQYEGYDTCMQHTAHLSSSRDHKTNISHSTIEKQRRDRINSLIDELRDLVPASAAMKGPDGSDMKRPKHVVLSDTISLLRHMKDRAAHDAVELQQLRQAQQQLSSSSISPAATAGATSAGSDAPALLTAAAPVGPPGGLPPDASAADGAVTGGASALHLLQRSLNGSAAATRADVAAAAVGGAGSRAGSTTSPELPQAPCNQPASVGVLVEEGPGCFLVKVNCKDRRGLLSDITSAIKSLPLQITRAAITTSEAGAVYDVFEIVVEPGVEMEGVSALDVQFQVHQALYKWRMGTGGSSDGSQDTKRRRSDE